MITANPRASKSATYYGIYRRVRVMEYAAFSRVVVASCGKRGLVYLGRPHWRRVFVGDHSACVKLAESLGRVLDDYSEAAGIRLP